MHERKDRNFLPFVPRLGHQNTGPREYSNLFRNRKIQSSTTGARPRRTLDLRSNKRPFRSTTRKSPQTKLTNPNSSRCALPPNHPGPQPHHPSYPSWSKLEMFILPGNEQPIATVKHPCWESYRRIADKTKVALRRVLHRVLRLDLTASTPRTAECGSSRAFGSQKVPGAPSAPSSKRQPESATNWIQHNVNMA
ncbi:hypothetical protein PITC_094680 [Penicillium italicum]|uniref:Uncharacterized protein n=1 Tax=Penicillium italicum TaxID=40296 RepID=A0A0A2KY89_PENIT|nr:hypothetical protein PITC_094680 [Penicillium italicum]